MRVGRPTAWPDGARPPQSRRQQLLGHVQLWCQRSRARYSSASARASTSAPRSCPAPRSPARTHRYRHRYCPDRQHLAAAGRRVGPAALHHRRRQRHRPQDLTAIRREVAGTPLGEGTRADGGFASASFALRLAFLPVISGHDARELQGNPGLARQVRTTEKFMARRRNRKSAGRAPPRTSSMHTSRS
jgi:hypothetical protein